jgi:UDP-N-acetylmuramate: L-alanyl-gamma-D-glutamyl-meso-diaminopimelate ligase
MPPGGLVVCDARDPAVRSIVATEATSRIAWYAIEGDDTGEVTPTWLAALTAPLDGTSQAFDLYAAGVACGRYTLRVPGRHNVRNSVAAIAACAEGFGVSERDARTCLATFQGVARRQDLLGEPGGVRVYDDFAHHPTAVDETLRALRARHPEGALWVAFEPRSATACRNVHQAAYARAFDAADRVLLAPLGRTTIAPEEQLDLAHLARTLGTKADASPSVDAIVDRIAAEARPGDTVALLSNGSFGGIHRKLLDRLKGRSS